MSGNFQTTVNFQTALGVPGELFDDGPMRSNTAVINSASAAYNIIGATAFTLATQGAPGPVAGGNAQPQVAAAGGTGFFVGILANPKVYASAGASGDPLNPTLTLPNYTQGEFILMGRMFVALANAASVGDLVTYNTTSGVLGSIPPLTVGTATQSTTTLTVVTPSTGNLGVGSVVQITGAEPVEILALGTGTGGAGTYTVNVSQTVTPAAAISGTNVPPSGSAFVPHAVVDQFQVSDSGSDSTGLAVIRLTN